MPSFSLPVIEIWLIRALGLLIIMLPSLNINAGNFVYFAPELDIPMIFFWTIANASIFNQYILIIMGLYCDLITGAPLGFNSLIYLIFYYGLLNLKRYFIDTSFYAFWLGFAIFSTLFLIAKYLLSVCYLGEFFIPGHLTIRWLVLLLIYPSIHAAFSKIRI